MGTSTADRHRVPSVAEARVAVLLGGRSDEREVSLVSGKALLQALMPAPGDDRGPASARAIEIAADGSWCLDQEILSPPAALDLLADVDVFVLGVHGGEGEGGVLQGLLRACGKAFTGSDVEASALCMDKTNSRHVVAAHGLRTARGLTVRPQAWSADRHGVLAGIEAMGCGWVAKRRRGGSSLATRKVDTLAELAPAIDDALSNGDDALVEEVVHGVEATVAVLGNAEEGLRAFTPVEIRPHEGRIFDYEEKYSEQGAAEFCPPERLGEDACELLKLRALEGYQALGCAGYARLDFLVPEDGEPVFLEANTLPGFTSRSLFPRAARTDGMDFRELSLELVRLALSARRTPQ